MAGELLSAKLERDIREKSVVEEAVSWSAVVDLAL